MAADLRSEEGQIFSTSAASSELAENRWYVLSIDRINGEQLIALEGPHGSKSFVKVPLVPESQEHEPWRHRIAAGFVPPALAASVADEAAWIQRREFRAPWGRPADPHQQWLDAPVLPATRDAAGLTEAESQLLDLMVKEMSERASHTIAAIDATLKELAATRAATAEILGRIADIKLGGSN